MRLPILDKLENQLQESERELKVDIPKALKTAADHGDLSENAEYKAAKERQMFLESRISQLQKRISEVTALNINRIPKDRSGIGSTLELKEIKSRKTRVFRLVFPEEVSPEEGKISPGSPIGRTLLGKQKGDEVTLSIADEALEYEIIRMTTIHDAFAESDGD
tara:strand:- start:2907 stop:3395 length:489 start_codon:yes stop_codon:yes gene_type:complete